MEVEEQNTKEQIILVLKFNDINDRFSNNSNEPIPHDMPTEDLQNLVHSALTIASDTANTNYNQRISAVTFLLNCFRHSEHEALRKITLTLVSVRILATGSRAAANPDFISHSLRDYPRLHSAWKLAVKKASKGGNSAENAAFGLIPSFVESLLSEIESVRPGVHTVPEIRGLTALSSQKYLFILKCVEFVCDLLSQLPTRRFFHLYLQATHFIVRLSRTPLYAIQAAAELAAASNNNNNSENTLKAGKFHGFRQVVGFPQMVWRLERLDAFGVDDFSGSPLTPADIAQRGAERAQALQRVCYKMFPDKLRALALANIGAVQNRETLSRHLTRLTAAEVHSLAVALSLLSSTEDDGSDVDREFVTEVILRYLEAPSREDEEAARGSNLALFPTEQDLWPSDSGAPAMEDDSGDVPMALPSLNLQFLSADDYLQRNFELFRCESVYGAREGLERAISAMRPRPHVASTTAQQKQQQQQQGRLRAVDFCGASRMALPLRDARLVRVGQPALGETKPSEVLCELSVTLDQCPQAAWRSEWEGIRRHDILYAVRVVPATAGSDSEESFAARYGVAAVRGCEVVDVVDATTGASVLPKDVGVDDRRLPRGGGGGTLRTIRVRMDGAQYVEDNESNPGDGVRDFYASFNLVVRRREEECNYKAVLETIRSLMSTSAPTAASAISAMTGIDSFTDTYTNRIPDWLENTILGYYSPNNNESGDEEGEDSEKDKFVDFYDTFVDEAHLKSVYPEVKVSYEGQESVLSVGGWMYRVDKEGKNAVGYKSSAVGSGVKRNKVPFTKAQVGAIRAAMGGGGSGLTLVVGPPGTGKTDVAVQIVSNLYHTRGISRILVVTKSNNALNQIFEKLVQLNVDETHCLRLGHGERSLETTRDFSPRGRVDRILERRLAHLAAVDALAASMGVPEHEAYSATCEAALLFQRLYVQPRWEAYKRSKSSASASASSPSQSPFAAFFARWLPGFSLSDSECWAYLEGMFGTLRTLRPFELLRSPADRANYLLTHEARVVAMTATYAALRRRELQALGFKCDAVVMEEAGQILEVEAFVPLVLLRAPGRVVMIGDHRQLPPVVKCPALRAASRFDQSMFARLVRLGVPTHVLDAQGRARESLAALYSWAYPGGLRTLPSLLADPRFGSADAGTGNPGFARVCQLVDVGGGAREAAPAPHFYQNVAEAEFLVHTYIYMRLLGYPRESVAILTTYNGQRSLLREVVAERCCKTQALRDLVGAPAYVGTVDKFQGRQADYVLLSLVRTESLGHLRDPRRLVVALSRARLGLYVFGARSLFLRSASGDDGEELSSASKDLRMILGKLFGESPSALQLIPSERWSLEPLARKDAAGDAKGVEVKSVRNVDELLPVLAPLVSEATAGSAGAKSNVKGKKKEEDGDEDKKMEVEVVENGGKLIESMVDVNSEDVIIPIHTNTKNDVGTNDNKVNDIDDEEEDDEDMN